jgi:hypothetical protein
MDDSSQVTATITNAGTNDTLTMSVANSGCTFNFGSVSLGADYVTGIVTFFGTTSGTRTEMTWTPATATLRISLGSVATGSGSVRTGVAAGLPAYVPSSALEDVAGNVFSSGYSFSDPNASRF